MIKFFPHTVFCVTCRFWAPKCFYTGEVIGEFLDPKTKEPLTPPDPKNPPFWGECRCHAARETEVFDGVRGPRYPNTHRRHWCGKYEERRKTVEGLLMKYFVLKPVLGDPYGAASILAIREYARMIRPTNEQLADDLDRWMDEIKESENDA